MKKYILSSAIHGLHTWIVYGIVEFWLACAFPVLLHANVELLGWQWRLIAQIFGVYALVGSILGAIGGVLLVWTERHRNRHFGFDHGIMAALTLVLAYMANLVFAWPLGRSGYIAIAVAAMLAVVFTGALADGWPEHTAFLANPWAVSLLLLGNPWIGKVLLRHSNTLKVCVTLLLIAATLMLANLWHRFQSGSIVRRAVIMAGPTLLVWLICVLFLGKHPTVRANQVVEAAAGGRPNVLLITMDTVRADHLSVYGYERDTTPHLREFAHEATVYNQVIAAADMTLPAHASIFTGLYPSWHGAYLAPPEYPSGRPMAKNIVTLAEALHSEGYWTGAVAANYGQLQPSMGVAKGFAIYDLPMPVLLSDSNQPFYMRESAWRILRLVADTAACDTRSHRAADVNRHAIALLEQAGHSRPFFLFLNYMDAHEPYVPPSPFDALFPGRDPHFKPLAGHGDLVVAVNGGHRHINAAEKRHLVSQYDGAIAYMDSEIVKVLARLRDLGLYENTLIIITSDHGEAFGERDLVSHAVGSVYQDQVHVPLLIKYPGQREAHQSDVLSSQVDLMPTILDVAGIMPPAGLQGLTLRLPRTEGSNAVYSQGMALALLRPLNRRFQGVRRAIVSGSWKLITWTEGPPELYDLAADPGETSNLYRTGELHATALSDRLAAWVAAAPRQFEQPGKLDRTSVERLKSLGYAQ